MKSVLEGSRQSYYAAVLVFESSSNEDNHQPLYEESVVLVEASSEENAEERAIQLGKAQETSYQNQDGQTINHRFKCLLEVQLVQDDQIKHGSTVYSRHFRDYAAYENFEPLLNGQSL